MIKPRRMKWASHVARKGEGNYMWVIVRKPEAKGPARNVKT
jgi:hypothetical protein